MTELSGPSHCERTGQVAFPRIKRAHLVGHRAETDCWARDPVRLRPFASKESALLPTVPNAYA
ncbi:hypothetical protein N183_31105 [Sinorhizobium sp. Sb3]|nr:hypothetical protein ASE60_19645 [Ensifer sp. Root278]KSV68361.1 hypothetical protein N183_31105 [Sinorhizobium sp. Sb3]